MKAGDRVRVLTGAHGATEGVVSSTYRGWGGQDVVNVRMTVPRLITMPDGPRHEVTLPYGPSELEVLADAGRAVR